ncbi:Integrator complex subunit 7 [Fasciola hepatica]|uniref:Integrator complex subunit 7 n=1 Tax=Fasciola hepatica TaxID=6192 RepID=A0A4E0RVR8_FASHE|nr:Integrator complex subunit 7 [Fasciola hepatica]
MTAVTQYQMHESDLGKDANVLIMELNKGLQSPNLGEQCKAIAQFPNLLEKYPFPMVVNSIFLKITQIFCDGSNYLRLCVLRACTECRAQLEKLTICDDIVRKLMPFTSSNDPAARALTLRLFGTLSRITSEHIGVHHAILKQINSHYEVESDAAIWSSHQLASVSSAFAISLCPILCKLLNEMSSDWDVKLKLLRLGKHMHHEVQIVDQMRSCLVTMLTTYSNIEFVVSILDTLTLLTTRAPIHTTEQLDLLLRYLAEDKRPLIRQCSLRNLSILAKHVPHQWDRTHLEKLCELYNSKNQSLTELEDIVHVLCCLTDTEHAVDLLRACSQDQDRGLVPCIRSTLLRFPTSRLTILIVQLTCKLLILFANSEITEREDSLCGMKLSEFVTLVVTHFLVNETDTDCPGPWYISSKDLSEDELKLTYSLLVRLFSCHRDYATCLHEMNLWHLITPDGGPRVGLLCQFLTTLLIHLPELTTHPSIDQKNLVTVETLLERLNATKPNVKQMDNNTILAMCGLIFQLSADRFLTAKECHSLLSTIVSRIEHSDTPDQSNLRVPSTVRLSPWLAYQVARQSSRYGQHMLAANIYESLSPQSLSERSSYWIQGLIEFSKTEATVISVARRLYSSFSLVGSDDEDTQDMNRRPAQCTWVLQLIDALRCACDSALTARTTLICVGGPDTRWFQAEYVGVRADLFSALAELCSSAYHHSRFGRWPGLENVATVEQVLHAPFWLSDQLDSWDALAKRVDAFRAQCLDADKTTREHLSAIACLIAFVIRILQSLIGRFQNFDQNPAAHNYAISVSTPHQTASLSSNSDPFAAILPSLENTVRTPLDFKPVAFANFDWIPRLV